MPTVLDNTWGAMLVCATISSVLLGSLTVQVHTYFDRRCNNDSWRLKSVVAVTWVLEVAHQAFASLEVYLYVVTHYGHPEFLVQNHWPISGAVCLEPIVAFMVQIFFARRGWLLNKSRKLLVAVIIVFSFIQLAGGLWATQATSTLPTFAAYGPKTYIPVIWLGAEAIADLLITYVVIDGLRKAKTGFTATDRGITNIINWTLSTGLLTSLFAVITVLLRICSGDTMWHLGFTFLLGRIYSNSFLASLNRRGTWFNKTETSQPQRLSTELSDVRSSSQGRSQSRPSHSTSSMPTTISAKRPTVTSDTGSDIVLDITHSYLSRPVPPIHSYIYPPAA